MVKVWSVRMEHFIGDLGHVDNTVEKHYVPHRLFKIEDDLYYDPVEHPVLRGNFNEVGLCEVKIFHLAYCGAMWEIKKRYDNHLLKSNMHTPEFLKQWYYWHLFGQYPNREVNPADIPEIILNKFGIDKDEI